jgi:predicted transglutaminase-like cysteine proteinase
VLVLRSDHGDLVFDNRTDDLLLWHETNLRFLARQVPGDPRFWRRLVSPL